MIIKKKTTVRTRTNTTSWLPITIALLILRKAYKRRAQYFIKTSLNVNQITAQINMPHNF